MSNIEFIGYLAVYGITFIAGVLALVKPIINLNISIQKLNDSLDNLNADSQETKVKVDKHEDKLADHETRISIIEKNRNQ